MSDELFSTMDNPQLEFAMEVRLWFTRVQMIAESPLGGRRTAVYVDKGEFHGPRLNGKAVPNSGGDYAYFTPDDKAMFDARYMLEEDDGTLILINNRGYLWGRKPDTMQRLRQWAFEGGEPVPHSEYYLRAAPSFEVTKGKHDWLTKHVFIGIGERLPDGNRVRYYAVK
ncbi:MAG: DUF3237 domain-containing protein [Parvularculaceae bacterium]